MISTNLLSMFSEAKNKESEIVKKKKFTFKVKDSSLNIICKFTLKQLKPAIKAYND